MMGRLRNFLCIQQTIANLTLTLALIGAELIEMLVAMKAIEETFDVREDF